MAGNLSGANQRGPRFATSPFSWPITSVGFLHIARQRSILHHRSTIHRVASQWLVKLKFAFRPLWNPTERTETLTRRPYPPVYRAMIYALQLKIQKKSPSAQWTVHPLNVDGGSKSYFLAKICAAKLAELTNIGFEIARKDAMKKILYCNSPTIFSRIIYKRYEEY